MKKYIIYIIIIVTTYYCHHNTFAQNSSDSDVIKINKRVNAPLTKRQTRLVDDSTNTSLNKKSEVPLKYKFFNGKLPSSYIAFLISPKGASIPIGSFGAMNFDDPNLEPGFALNGKNYKIDVVYYLYKRLGLNLSFGQQTHQFSRIDFNETYGNYDNINVSELELFNDLELINNLVIYYPFPGSEFLDNYDSQYSKYNIYLQEKKKNRTNWKTIYFMIGPVYSLNFGKRLTIDLKASIGTVKITKPSFFYNSYNFVPDRISTGYINIGQIMYSSSSSNGFGYGFGTTIRYDIIKNLALMVGADFLQINSNMKYNYYKTTYEEFDISGKIITQKELEIKRNYNFATINVNLGLAIQLNRKIK